MSTFLLKSLVLLVLQDFFLKEINLIFCLTRVVLGCRGLSPPLVMKGRTPDIEPNTNTNTNTRKYNNS